MGNKRNLTFSLAVLTTVVSLVSAVDAQTDSSVQSAYYQPLTQQQYAQHQQASYQQPEWMKPASKVARPFGPAATRLPNSQVAKALQQAPQNFRQPSMQQQAAQLLTQESARLKTQQRVPQPFQDQGLTAPGPRTQFNDSRPGGMHRAGFRRQDSDPFGENQAQGNTPPTFDPFADPPKTEPDPFGEGQARPNNGFQSPFADPPQADPVPNDPVPNEPVPNEPVLPGSQGGNQLSDPVMPKDATPSLEPTPRSVIQDDEPSGDGSQDLPNPFDDPVPPKTDLDYLQAPAYRERFVPNSSVYRTPSPQSVQQGTPQGTQQRMPPIVQPNQAPQMHHPGFAAPAPLYQPAYQPAYQPIPGQQHYSPTQPYVAAPTMNAPLSAPAPVQAAPANNVYSPVVAAAPSSCGSCGGGCASGKCGLNSSGCPNFYFSSMAGWNGLRDVTSQTGLGEFQTDDGTVFGFALGRRNGRNLRTELEFSFRENDVTGFLDSSGTLTDLNGDLSSYSGMANAYWEFTGFKSRLFKPYVGGGIGFISIDSDIRDANQLSILPDGLGNDTSLAFQYMAGVNYKAYRNVDLFAEYRYHKADSFRLDTNSGNSDRYQYGADNIVLGLRWKF